jgi:hypothetical protein
VLKTFTASTDFGTGQGKRLASVELHSVAGCTVDFKDSAGGGATQFRIIVPANVNVFRDYSAQPYFGNGLNVVVAAGALDRGCINLV